MRIKKIEAFRLQLPLRMPIRHNLAEHRNTDNIVLRVTTDAGVTGFGEGVPRKFVTGETHDESTRILEEDLVPRLASFQAGAPEHLKAVLVDLLAEGIARAPAACCALELALFDAAGKTWGLPLAGFFGPSGQPLVYSAVVPMLEPAAFRKLLHLVRAMKMPFVKLKVGGKNDAAPVALSRRILGGGVDLRIDANGAWSGDEAVDRIMEMMPYGISAVEQPVAKEDLEGMRWVAERIPVPVVADECLCTQADAEKLVDLGSRVIFNLRLSKCGGMSAVDRMYRFARRHGVSCQLGCQVGETGLLSAAGRQMAQTRAFVYLEGSYSRFLLREDIVKEPVDIGLCGVAAPMTGDGAGVGVDLAALSRLSVSSRAYRL